MGAQVAKPGSIGAYYPRESLGVYARDVLGPDDPGFFVNLTRMAKFQERLIDQVSLEVTRYVEIGLLPYLDSDKLGQEEKDYIKECVLVAQSLQRRIHGQSAKDLAPLGFGSPEEEQC